MVVGPSSAVKRLSAWYDWASTHAQPESASRWMRFRIAIWAKNCGRWLMFGLTKRLEIPTAAEALPGRSEAIEVSDRHLVTGAPTKPPFAAGLECAVFGMGCFWGAERLFWELSGVHSTQVGYAGGHTRNPTYQEVCSGLTGHTEVVRVVFDPKALPYSDLLAVFWESHDPTQGMRQGHDIGTQYRSAVYTDNDAQAALAQESAKAFAEALAARSFPPVTTEIAPAPVFYYAEDYHQQYLAKNPDGYCGLRGTGVACPTPPAR